MKRAAPREARRALRNTFVAGGAGGACYKSVGPPPDMHATTTLLLLPGLDGTEVLFGPLRSALPSWIRPRVVPYPPTGGNGYADLLPLVERSAEGVSDYFVLGWSFSGPLALMLAAGQPHRARGVILCSSFVRPPVPAARWLRLVTVSPTVTLLRLARRAPAHLLGRGSTPLARAQAQTWARVPSRTVAERARAALSLDARDTLRRCACPVLYLGASRDGLVRPRSAEEVARERPASRMVTIDGHHLALFTNAGAAADAIARFMLEVPKA